MRIFRSNQLSDAARITLNGLGCTAVLCLAAACQPGPDDIANRLSAVDVPTPLSEAPGELPQGTDVVAEMLGFLEAQDRFAFQAVVHHDAIQEDGSELQFDRFEQILVARPDRMAWVTIRDDARVDSVRFSDGTLSLNRQPDNVYGQIAGPATITELIPHLEAEYAIAVPFGDLLGGEARSIFLDNLESSLYVGEAWLSPVWTHHVLLRKADVDIQIWIGMGDQPLPVRLKMTWKNEPGTPSFTSRFHEWRLDPVLSPGSFEFHVPDDAELIRIVPRLDRFFEGGEG